MIQPQRPTLYYKERAAVNFELLFQPCNHTGAHLALIPRPIPSNTRKPKSSTQLGRACQCSNVGRCFCRSPNAAFAIKHKNVPRKIAPLRPKQLFAGSESLSQHSRRSASFLRMYEAFSLFAIKVLSYSPCAHEGDSKICAAIDRTQFDSAIGATIAV